MKRALANSRAHVVASMLIFGVAFFLMVLFEGAGKIVFKGVISLCRVDRHGLQVLAKRARKSLLQTVAKGDLPFA